MTTIKRLIRSGIIAKYFILILIAAGAAYLSLVEIHPPSEPHSVQYSRLFQEVTSGAVAALLLSLVYDVFTKLQDREARKLEMGVMLSHLSKQLFVTNGVLAVQDDAELADVVRLLIKDTRFIQAIAEVTTERRGYGAAATLALLGPLWQGDTVPELFSWENHFTPHSSDPNKYVWRSKQWAALRAESEKFRLALTDNALTEANLLSSESFDCIIVLEKYDATIIPFYMDRSNLSVTIHYHSSGKRKTVKPLQAQCVSHDSIPLPDTISQEHYERIAIIEFEYPPDARRDPNAQIEWECATELSFATPFCYIQADRFCYLRDLVIDYRELKEVLSAVWAVSFIGNPGTSINHDPDRGRIVSQIDGTLMPGQGIAVVWRHK